MDDVDLAYQFNARVFRIASIFAAGTGDDEQPVEFLCECGCLTAVPLTTAQYAARGGAFLAGHERLGQHRDDDRTRR